MGARLSDEAADVFDADYDPTEVQRVVPDTWHNSFMPYKHKSVSVIGDRSLAEKCLREAKAILPSAKKRDEKDRERFRNILCWHDTDITIKKMLAHLANLPRDVVGKLDRDLTEQEKAALRIAARTMTEVAGRLVSL